MKKFLTIILFCLPAFGQAAYSGPGLDSGPAAYGAPASGGAPLTYAARADNCVHGYSSAFYNTSYETCTPGATTGESGSGLVFQGGCQNNTTVGCANYTTFDPLPFKRLDDATTPAWANTGFTDPDFGSYSVFATDNGEGPNASICGTYTALLNMGSDGGYDAFGTGAPPFGNSNDLMFYFTTNGSITCLAHVIESRILAKTCSLSNPCVIASAVQGANCTPGSTCTNTQITNGAVAFSRNFSDAPNTIYELALPQIYKDTFTESGLTVPGGVSCNPQLGAANCFPTGTGDTISRTLYVDFSASNVGVAPTGYVAGWNSTFAFGNNGEVSVGAAGGAPWQASTAYGPTTLNYSFILPTSNNPSHHAYYATTSGTTSGSQPVWNGAGCTSYAAGATCADGGETWLDVGPTHVQGQGFDIFHYDPARGPSYINTYLGLMYRGYGQGAGYTPGCVLPHCAASADPSGQLTTNVTSVCYLQGGTNCGSGGIVNLPEGLSGGVTLHAVDQKFNPQYGSMTTDNGTYFSCLLGTEAYTQFAYGSPATVTWPTTAWSGANTYYSGQYVSGSDGNYYKATATTTNINPVGDGGVHWTLRSGSCYNIEIDWYSTLTYPILEIGPNYGADGHNAEGAANDFRGGSYWQHYFTQPNCQGPANSNCPTVSGNQYVGMPYPGVKTLVNSLPSDGHPTYRNVANCPTFASNPALCDQQPMFDAMTDVPLFGSTQQAGVKGGRTGTAAFVGSYCCAGYGEEIAWTLPPASGSYVNTLWRFGHQWNTGSNSGFGIQNAIGVNSQAGTLLAYTSDFTGTRGDQATASNTCQHPNRGMYTPLASGTVNLNDTISFANGGPVNVYQAVGFYSGTFPSGSYVTTGTGTEGSTLPSWNLVCGTTGQYCTSDNGDNPATGQPLDGNVLWLNQGPNTCRSDIGIMSLLSAHPAP